jgi:cytochrome oxidase Cu insertion factor (SCO1/SenC/PrrC family)
MSDVIPAKTSRTRSRISFLMLAGLFLAPVILAWLVFYVFPDFRPTGTINHGELVEPVRPIPAFNMQSLDGRTLDETFWRGKWTFVYLIEGSCDEACIEHLYTIRQIRLAQGKNIDRLQRLLFMQPADSSATAVQTLQEKFPGLVILPVTSEYAGKIWPVFQVDNANPLKSNYYYLVDPLGNLMMRYSSEIEPQGIIKDLERLLKYSGLG